MRMLQRFQALSTGSVILALGLAAAACGDLPASAIPGTLDAAGTQCKPGQAVLAVYDGFLQRLCGCSEPTAQVQSHTGSLTCTAPAGTTFFFHYVATMRRHQILSTGAPSFVSSGISTPTRRSALITAHAVRIDAAGTYAFTDSFDSGLSGQLVVQ